MKHSLLVPSLSIFVVGHTQRKRKAKEVFTNMLKDGLPTTPYATFEASYTS